MRLSTVVSVLAALLPSAHSLASTDSPQDGDVPQSGYTTNHNFDPALISTYTVNWTSTFNNAEFFYAKPLVYTPNNAPHEYVYVVSNQNIVRVLDGMTGAVLQSRTLEPPFQSSDSQCGDIPNTIGIISTPIIDTEKDIMYFWSKSYIDGGVGPEGVAYGNWKLYAVNIADLSDAPGFPISIEGLNAYNDRTKYIISGTLNQRPGLAMLGNIIITGFGSHCDNFNFTGYLITASKTPGVGITDIQAMVAAPGAPPQALNLLAQNNGKSGIWMGGFGIALDEPNNRIFFATGNGEGMGQLNGDNGVPTSGKTYLSTLENTVANYAVDPNTGLLTQQDWWCPTNYDHLNGADRDIGSSGVALLDPGTFSGGGVERIAVAAGKNGTIIIMDANNLGGFKNGPGETDGVLQIISFPPSSSFFSGVASYPLEGGYIYFAPTNDRLYCYQFGMADGLPHFTLAGQSAMIFGGEGAPRVTTLNGQAGTGIVWMADINQGVVAYSAVPVNGVLEPLPLVRTSRLNKFHRPQFGNARLYTAELNQILAMGGRSAPPSSFISQSSSSTSSSTSTSSSSSSISSSSTSSSPSSSTSSSSSSSSSISTSSTSSSSTTQTSTPSSTSSSSSSSMSTITTLTTSTTTSKSSSSSSSITTPITSASKSSSTFSLISLTSTPTSSTPPIISSTPEPSPVCRGDNCLNELQDARFSAEASVFCLTYTTTVNTVPSAIPSYLENCQSSPARVSSACSCLMYNPTAIVPITTSSSSSSATGLTSRSPSTTSSSLSSSIGVSSSSTSTTSSSISSSTMIISSSTGTSIQSSSNSSSTTSTPASYTTPTPASGGRVNVNWNLTWVNAAPDGYMRPMIGVNGQWPPPPIVLNYGNTLILDVYNGLGNESTSIHFHGIRQINTNYADGPTFATQCPVPPGNSITYEFIATQVGTFWYHSHHAGQYIDGLRGPLIIKNPAPPYGSVGQDVTVTLSDHYHEEAPNLINFYQSVNNTNNYGGDEPVPDSNLINDAQNIQLTMTPGQTSLFRIINMGSVAGQYLQFDQHTMTIVEVDGQYVQPYEVQQLFVAVAQRYGVIVNSMASNTENYAIVATMDAAMFSNGNAPANPTVSGWLVYNEANPLPAPFTLVPQPFADTNLVPLDQEGLLGPPAQTIYMSADFGIDENGITRGFLNGVTYVNQDVPTLYSVLTAPAEYLNNPIIYGTGSNPTILLYGAIIEIDIDNHDDRAHPFHLHGHAFQVIFRSDNGYLWPGLYETPTLPMKRDVITVYPQGTVTIRFVADNPGIQLFHCHTEWHVVSGMMATFIEAPTELVASKPYIPVSHRPICQNYGIPMIGNAAGNSANWLDLTGAPTAAPTNNWGALTNPPA